MNQLSDDVEKLLDGPRPLPLVLAGDPVLRTPSMPYDFGLPAELWTELISAMRESMHAAPGVGLAAPQIGLGIRVAVLEDAATVTADIAADRQRYQTAPRVLVNPQYEAAAGSVAEFYEGCLSVPGYQAVVPRSTAVRLTAVDEQGAAVDEVVTGWAARIVAHETDHLNGVLYLDRALTRSLSTTANLVDQWSGTPLRVIRERLQF
ncbi:MAG: peptide deformylase [Nakamurella sp.]